eukprot:5452017-Prymnesium_polylepis.2
MPQQRQQHCLGELVHTQHHVDRRVKPRVVQQPLAPHVDGRGFLVALGHILLHLLVLLVHVHRLHRAPHGAEVEVGKRCRLASPEQVFHRAPRKHSCRHSATTTALVGARRGGAQAI